MLPVARVPPCLRRHNSEPGSESDFELWPEEVAWLMTEDFNLKLNRTIGRCKSCR